jgi:hypothetical protein
MATPTELTGLDGSNPLAFLAAIGTLRLATRLYGSGVEMRWVSQGRWIPVLRLPDGVSPDQLVADLYGQLHKVADPDAAAEADNRLDRVQAERRVLASRVKALKARKLRGEERQQAEAEEVAPVQEKVDELTRHWRAALAKATPTAYLGLGQRLDVESERFASFEKQSIEQLGGDGLPDRDDADFATAFGCSGCVRDNGCIEPTAFQLITGAGHQYFLQTISDLMGGIAVPQIQRALFGPWTWEDRRLSFRWGPDEDRRYAYAWNDPSDGQGVPSEHGANLLAAMALPMFPTAPVRGRLQTSGIHRIEDGEAFTWPVWAAPASADVVRSLLALAELRQDEPDRSRLRRRGVVEVFRSQRIKVGSGTNARLNLTAAVSV